MNKKAIDTIVWWIPFKKTRNAVRELLDDLAFIRSSVPPEKKFQMDIFILQFQVKKS